MSVTRRKFLNETLSSCSAFGVGVAFASLGARFALGADEKNQPSMQPVKDLTTGLPLLRLPEGFQYLSYGWTKDLMGDGTITPPAHDGMGVVSSEKNILTLVRNHEISEDNNALNIKNGTAYDPQAGGGCTTLKFDTSKGKFTDSFVSISGTSRNCAGGITPWGTWLTAEETVLGIGSIDTYKNNAKRKFEKDHGWIFEVDPEGTKTPTPLKAMGRFVHEALAVDHDSGIVYETEDRETSGFYRFIPKVPGKLAEGGELQILQAMGADDLRGGVENGKEFDVTWHTIPNPELANTPGLEKPDELGVFKQGKKLGGTTFSRLEGCWRRGWLNFL